MKTKIFSAVMALALIFSACNKDSFQDVTAEAGSQSGSKITWNVSDKDFAVNIAAVENNTRKNASGPKITSNAHSADFPGIYFIWDSKQKDNGYLKVDGWVFEKYESFVLTAKESNTYWDFKIELQDGQETTDDGCYVFYIPKVYNNKNINMVFISEFKERIIPCEYETVTVWFHPNNGGIWNQYMASGSAIIPLQYNKCDDDCFDKWIEGITPESLWADDVPEAELEKFLDTFEGWLMSLSLEPDVKVAVDGYCDPVNVDDKGVKIWAKHGESIVKCVEVDVWFYPMNGGKWGNAAIIKKVYNSCEEPCFETWAKQFTPADLWGGNSEFDEFMCTFEELVMGKHKGTLPYYDVLPWSCEPFLSGENSRPGVSIFAVHGENKCLPPTGSITATATLLETWKEETHSLVYKVEKGSRSGTLVSKSGTAFGNGHTYIAATDGVHEIANSSPSNAGIGFFFTVEERADGFYIILDEKIVSASIGAVGFDVVPSQSDFRAPSHSTVSREFGPIKTFVSSGNQNNAPVYTGNSYLYVHLSKIEWNYVTDEVVGCELDEVDSGTQPFTENIPVYKVFDAAGNEVGFDDLLLGTYTVKLYVDDVEFGSYDAILDSDGQVYNVNFGNITVGKADCVVICDFDDCPGCLSNDCE